MTPYVFKKSDAERFASTLGIRVKYRQDELMLEKCPYCGRKEGNFSINLVTGQFKCLRQSCGAHGNMLTLHRDFNFDLGQELSEYENPRTNYRKFARPDAPLAPTQAAIAYLHDKRQISEEVIRRYQIVTHRDDPNRLVFPFYDEHGEMVFIKYRAIDFDPEKGGNKEWCERSMKTILFGMMQCTDYDRLIITEGQIDSLSVATAGFPNACSVPTGARGMTWVPHCWDWVNQFKEIVVFGDWEKDHMTLLKDISERFSCKVSAVRQEDYRGCKDANELLCRYGVEAVRDAIHHARPEMLPEVLQLEEVDYYGLDAESKLSTGVRKLDNTLHGGFRYGSFNILTGVRGEGKSTFGSMLVKAALEQDLNVFIYAGEQDAAETRKLLDMQLCGDDRMQVTRVEGMDYSKYTVPRYCERRLHDWYQGRLYAFNTAVVTMETVDLLRTIETYLQRFGCKFVFIDNLMTAIDLCSLGKDKFERQELFCKALARMAVKYNAVILLVAHKRKGDARYNLDENDSVLGSSEITNLASVVMSYGAKQEEKEQGIRRLKILKNRPGKGVLNFEGFIGNYLRKSSRIWFDEAERDAVSVPFREEQMSFVFEEIEVDDMDIPF